METHEKTVEMSKTAHRYATKKMYRVEKFLPTECPKCRHPFRNGEMDWLILGEETDGKMRFQKLDGCDIVICAQCGNYTIQFPLEAYHFSSKSQAQKFCDESGFVNLTEVLASDANCQDSRTIYCQPPGIKIERILTGLEDVADDVDLEADEAEIHDNQAEPNQ